MMNNAKKLTSKKKREHKNTHRKINDFDYTKLVTLKVQINKKVFLFYVMWCDDCWLSAAFCVDAVDFASVVDRSIEHQDIRQNFRTQFYGKKTYCFINMGWL